MTTPPDESPPAGPTDDTRLVGLLAAYQLVQAQNIRLTRLLSTTLAIGSTDLRVLLFVYGKDDATAKDVAVRLDYTSGSVTSIVDRLDALDLLRRERHPTDRRSHTLRLTTRGLSTVDSVRNTYKNAFATMLSDEQVRSATTVLHTLAAALEHADVVGGDTASDSETDAGSATTSSSSS